MLGLLLILVLLVAAAVVAVFGIVLALATTVGLVWLLVTGCRRIARRQPGGWPRVVLALTFAAGWTALALA